MSGELEHSRDLEKGREQTHAQGTREREALSWDLVEIIYLLKVMTLLGCGCSKGRSGQKGHSLGNLIFLVFEEKKKNLFLALIRAPIFPFSSELLLVLMRPH